MRLGLGKEERMLATGFLTDGRDSMWMRASTSPQHVRPCRIMRG
jgi:hypothetical protein